MYRFRRNGERRARVLPAVAVSVMVGVIALAGCGSGGSNAAASGSGSSTASPAGSGGPTVSQAGGGSSANTVPSTPSSAPTTPSAAPSAAGSGSAASGQAPFGQAASDTAAIEKAYQVFFAPNEGSASMDHLQNGEQFKAVLDQQGQSESSLAAGASAHVSKVTVISPDVAKVVYTIEVDGKPMLQNQPGYAVKQDGTWKVSDYTFCGLLHLELGDKVPAVCNSAAATQAPS